MTDFLFNWGGYGDIATTPHPLGYTVANNGYVPLYDVSFSYQSESLELVAIYIDPNAD